MRGTSDETTGGMTGEAGAGTFGGAWRAPGGAA
jgi:hypothetical protein